MSIKQDQMTSGGKDKHMHRQTDRQTDIPIYHTCGYTATPVACGWAGADFKVTGSFGQEQCGQRMKKPK